MFKKASFLIIILLGVLFSFQTAFASTIYFFDNFDDDHGELSTHTPTNGTSWTKLIDNGVDLWTQFYDNHVTVQANTLNAGSLYQANGTYSSPDYDVSAIVTFSSGDSSYTRTLAARIQDSNNMYALTYGRYYMQIFKREAGVWTALSGVATPNILGDIGAPPYHGDTVTFRLQGNTLTALHNGATVLTVTDSTFTNAGSAGMGLGRITDATDDAGTGVGIDNFSVQSIVTNPTISSLSPLDNATGIAVDANLVITFDQAVDVESGNITIYRASDGTAVEVIDVTSGQVSGSGTTAITINPSNNFTSETSYYIQIDATAFDNSGGDSFSGINDSATWNFTTADVLAPLISSLSPLDNATGIAVDANLVISFNESVDVESGNINIYNASNDNLVASISVNSGQVSGSGTSTITINPTSDLAENTSYYVQIDATAFDDVSGNSFAGLSDNSSWNFTTIDTASPVISSLSPANLSTGVSLDSNLTISFSEPVLIGNGSLHIRKVSYGVLVESIDITSSQITGNGTNTITINPSQSFLAGTDYYIEVDATAFDDASGNSFVGFSDMMTWSFSTAGLTSVGGGFMPGFLNSAFLPNRPLEATAEAVTQPDKVETSLDQVDYLLTVERCELVTKELIRAGKRGDLVKKLQHCLFLEGYELDIDGIFGPVTLRLVKDFQTKHDLLVDGIVGPETIRQFYKD